MNRVDQINGGSMCGMISQRKHNTYVCVTHKKHSADMVVDRGTALVWNEFRELFYLF